VRERPIRRERELDGAEIELCEEVTRLIEKIERAPYRRLKSAVSRIGKRETWSTIASALVKVGRLSVARDPGRSRNLARAALFAAARIEAPELDRLSLFVEAESLAGDSLRRLRRRRQAEHSFARAARHIERGCECRERAYFLTTLSDLREEQGRNEEALALRERAAKLYGALGEVDYQASVLSSKAALEMRRSETADALETISEILVLMDRGLTGSLALGAAVSFAALVSRSYLPEAIFILEEVRERYPDLRESEEMATLNLLEGRLLTFGTRPDLAEVLLQAAFRGFLKLGFLHDAALSALALAVLFIHSEREADLFASTEATTEALLREELPEGLRHTLVAFQKAVREGRATITLANACMSYIERSEETTA
jgi:tetratricopeptide (TPR) repeat protein